MVDLSEFQDQDLWWRDRPQILAERHVAALSLVRTEPILDVGGGDGSFALLLHEHGFRRVEVVDISPVAVQKARSRGISAHLLDIRRLPLPFEDCAFATVTILDVLEHLYNPLPLLRDCSRIGHHVVLSVPNFTYWRERLSMLLGHIPFECKPERGGHIFWFNFRVLSEMLNKADLEAEEVFFITPTRILPKSLWSRLGQLMPNLIPGGYVARCRRRTVMLEEE